MLWQKVIKPGHTELTAPIVFAAKKNGSQYFCTEYWKLNAIRKRDSYPVPRMEDCIYLLWKTAMFSVRGAKSGYWYIKVDAK